MYSIVMLTAMSAGADVTPAPAPHAVAPAMPVVMGGGCYGSMAAGCYGSCSGSCSGSCYGCSGGGFFRRSGGFLGHRSSCHGCCGGYACSGFSCFGSWRGSCHGCSGSCYGSCYGCYGVSYGSSWGPPVGMPPYTLHGYNSPSAIYGNVYYPNQPPVMTVPVAPMTKPSGSDAPPMGANLKFKVPADTKIYVDGKLAPGSGPERSFYTPPLEPGKKFFYEVKAELTVNGKTLTEEKKVIVEAGASLTEEFPKLVAAVEKADTVAGK